jgi:hypothetical protein
MMVPGLSSNRSSPRRRPSRFLPWQDGISDHAIAGVLPIVGADVHGEGVHRPMHFDPHSFRHSLRLFLSRLTPHVICHLQRCGTQRFFRARHSTRCRHFNVLRLPVARARPSAERPSICTLPAFH